MTSTNKVTTSIWETLNVPLPALEYENAWASGKGSTEWAAHSHSPLSVNVWTDFDALVETEGNKDGNKTTTVTTINLESELANIQRYCSPVSEEEHVTANLNFLLKGVSNHHELTQGIVFNTRSKELISSPHLIAMKRNDEGLGIGDIKTSPSVLQAIQTLVGFDDHCMKDASIHPAFASKAVRAIKKARLPTDPINPGSQSNLAATLFPWDCQVYDATESILLMTTPKYPFLIIKLQQNQRMVHVADEMANEAEVYAALATNKAVQEAIPKFYGHSTHLGVAMTCLEREMDDLDDIGLESVPEELKQSAVRAVGLLSQAGVLHNDLELLNIVQSRDDPCRAKIIDFGRAVFSSDNQLLTEQVERIAHLLGYR